jgi:hypothetical protein
LIQFYLLIDKTINAAQYNLEWSDSYEIIKNRMPMYKAMIPSYFLLIISLFVGIFSIQKRIVLSDYYLSSNSGLKYIKESISELGGVLGALIFVLNIMNISYGNQSKVDFFFGLDSKDLPHLFEVIPFLLTGYLFWTGFDLRRGKMKDYLTLTAFVIWVLLFIFSIFIIWLFSGSDYSHMP